MSFNKNQTRTMRLSQPVVNENRMSGRTTSTALLVVSNALANGGTWVRVVDHHGTSSADLHLYQLVMRVVNTLQLRYFEYRTEGGIRYVRCNQWTTNPWEIA